MNKEWLWRKPTYLPYLQPAISDELVKSAERQIGYKLPIEYLDLLRIQNGGYINYALNELPHDSISGIGPYYPSILNFDWEESQEWVSFPLKGLVPFDGDGHWHLCFDYRSNIDTPRITYIDLECDSQEVVAQTFSEYLELLEDNTGDDLIVNPGIDIGLFIETFSKSLNAKFDPPDTFAHGYPVYRANLGQGDNPEWIWISPNEVPDGFIRKGDARYNELKQYMENKAKRYPNVSNSAYIFSMTDGVREKVRNSLSACGIKYSYLKEVVNASNNSG